MEEPQACRQRAGLTLEPQDGANVYGTVDVWQGSPRNRLEAGSWSVRSAEALSTGQASSGPVVMVAGAWGVHRG